MSTKQDVILEALRASNEVWDELKQDWYKNKIPGSAYSPSEFVARLLIAMLNMSSQDVYDALEQSKKVSIELLKEEKILLGNFNITEDVAKIVIALLMGVPEVAVVEFGDEVAETPQVQSSYSFTSQGVVKPVSELVQPVSHCPNCKHDFERCENGFYETDRESYQEEVFAPTIEALSENALPCAHVDSTGKCLNCTAVSVRSCDGCNEDFIESNLRKCKDFESCDQSYCPECGKEEITSTGFCNYCGTISCDSCSDDIENGAQKTCINPECTSGNDLCHECALRLLNKKGECSSCSGETKLWCAGDCSEEFVESLLIKCRNFDECSYSYCSEDAKSSLNKFGYCSGCETVTCSGGDVCEEIDRGTEITCKNPDCTEDWVFCGDCARRYLNKQKLCSTCSNEEEYICDGNCQQQFTESLLSKCKNYETCNKEYCFNDAKSELDKQGYCPKCAENRTSSKQ